MMLALTPIAERLRAAGARNVAGLLEFSAQTELPRALPAHFVVPTGESANGNVVSGAHEQRVEVTFSVIVVLDAAARRTDVIAEDLKTSVDLVRGAIAAWMHPQAAAPTDYAGGRLVSADRSTVVWEVRFRSRYHVRKVQ